MGARRGPAPAQDVQTPPEEPEAENISTALASYLDPRTGRTYPVTDRRWRSDDDHPLMVTALPGIVRGEIDGRDRSIWRYRAAFPLAIDRPVSMGEGGTPLIQKDWDGLRPFFKLEWFNPTCSFKDRGAALLISFLRQLGVKAVIEDSSGNSGADADHRRGHGDS